MPTLKLPKPKAVLFDISGTAARESFVEKVLLSYFNSSYRSYAENNWFKQEFQDLLKQLAQKAENNSLAPKITINTNNNNEQLAGQINKKELLDQFCQYIEFCKDQRQQSQAYALFRFQVWFDGYNRGKIKTPVYSDVSSSLQRWKKKFNLKLFVLSNGWAEATKRFMSRTSQGDLTLFIDDHYDTSIGSLTQPETFTKVALLVGEKVDDIVFLTKSPEEGMAASKSGVKAVLVLTHRSAVESALEICRKEIPYVRTFTEIDWIENDRQHLPEAAPQQPLAPLTLNPPLTTPPSLPSPISLSPQSSQDS